jgi:hypothetical protein
MDATLSQPDEVQLFKLTIFVDKQELQQLLKWAATIEQPWKGLCQEADDGAYDALVERMNNASIVEVVYTTCAGHS